MGNENIVDSNAIDQYMVYSRPVKKDVCNENPVHKEPVGEKTMKYNSGNRKAGLRKYDER